MEEGFYSVKLTASCLIGTSLQIGKHEINNLRMIHRGRVTYMCVSLNCFRQRLITVRCQARIWNNGGILLTGTYQNIFHYIIKIRIFLNRYVYLEMLSTNLRPLCPVFHSKGLINPPLMLTHGWIISFHIYRERCNYLYKPADHFSIRFTLLVLL